MTTLVAISTILLLRLVHLLVLRVSVAVVHACTWLPAWLRGEGRHLHGVRGVGPEGVACTIWHLGGLATVLLCQLRLLHLLLDVGLVTLHGWLLLLLHVGRSGALLVL